MNIHNNEKHMAVDFSKNICITWKRHDVYGDVISDKSVIQPFNTIDHFECRIAGGPYGPHRNRRFQLCTDILRGQAFDFKVNAKPCTLEQVIEILLRKAIDVFDRFLKYEYQYAVVDDVKELIIKTKSNLQSNNVPQFQPIDLFTSAVYKRKRDIETISSFGQIPSDCCKNDYIW